MQRSQQQVPRLLSAFRHALANEAACVSSGSTSFAHGAKGLGSGVQATGEGEGLVSA